MSGEPTVALLCCDTLAPEVRRALEGVDRYVRVTTFPAACHLRRRDPFPAEAVQATEPADALVTLCGACHERPEPELAERMGVTEVGARVQAELLLGPEVTAAELDAGAYLVLPGWLSSWRAVIVEQWGFDRETARAFFTESFRKLVFVDTGLDHDAGELEALRDYCGLFVERRQAGTGYLRCLLELELGRRIQDIERRRHRAELAASRAAAADHAVVADFIAGLGNLLDEPSVVARLEQTASMLFAAEQVRWRPAGSVVSEPPGAASLVVSVTRGDAELGHLHVESVAMPERLEDYRRMARVLCDAAIPALNAARLHQREQRLVEQLRNKVGELDAFTYSASHDLKAPLRTIRGFADLLQRRHASDLSESANEYLQWIIYGSERMGRLIEGLLELAHVSRQDTPMYRLELGPLVDGVLVELRPQIDARGATVEVGLLPAVQANPQLMERVFHNLLGNALKYNDREHPLVTVGVREDGGEAAPPVQVLYVHDDGDGIAAKHHDAVFQMFRRLVPEEEIEGSGAGLAIVRKALERQGGKIWIENNQGEGCAFLFSLPAAEEQGLPEWRNRTP